MAKRKKKTKTSGDYKEYLLKSLGDPEEIAAYINAALEEDDDPGALLIALRHVVEAQNVSDLAKKAGLNRVTLYRILSEDGNPRLDSLATLLEAMGLKLKVEQKMAG
ncbi:MAG: addiction module antidote protein [Pseudomonadota bacterium]